MTIHKNGDKSKLTAKPKADEPVVTNTMKEAEDRREAADERAGLHDSGDDPKPKGKVNYEGEFAYNQGQTAARSSISQDDAPYGDGPDKDAWLAGWKSVKHG